MKKKIGGVFIFVLVICSLFFVLPLNGAYAYDASNIVESKYLISRDIDGNNIYLSDTVAGDTSGYGDYIVGLDNVALETMARDGYQVAGWNIKYTNEDEDIDVFLEANNATDKGDNTYSQEYTLDEANNIILSITYYDEVNNGTKNKSTLTISRIFDDLKIEPIFEYVYYNVKANVASTIGALGSLERINLSLSETLLYANKTEEDGITKYTNSYIQTEGNLFYYGDLFKVNQTIEVSGVNETIARYYTIHTNEDGTIEKVDYSLGAFRLNENVEYELNINVSDDLKNDVNIDILSANIAGSETIKLSNTGDNNYYSLTKDAYDRSSNISLKFDIINSTDLINEIEINYSNLYLVDFISKIDGNVVSGVEDTDILNVLSVINYYSKVSDKQYYVKTQADNNGSAFRVSTISTISKMVEGRTFNYYELLSLDGETNAKLYKSYSNISSNFEIEIEYASVEHTIDFRFALNNNGTLTSLEGNYNLELPRTAKRGEEVTVNKSDISNNIGFEFYGFSLSSTNFNSNNSISITIDENKPEDVTIIMVYELIDYTITLRNFNQINLVDGDETIYPINKIDFVHTQGSTNTNYVANASNLVDGEGGVLNLITYTAKVNLFDSVRVKIAVTNGFNILGFKPNNMGTLFTGNTFSFDISQDTISQFAVGTNIDIYVFEDYVRYTTTFYIEPTIDTNTNELVVMANIDVNAPDYAQITRSFIVEGEEIDYTVTHEIVVSNLKLYDSITMSAIGREITDENENTYKYIFIKFTENDIVNLSYTLDEITLTYSHTEKILRNNNIKVVFSMESSKLYVSSDRKDAYDLSKVSFMRNGELLTRNEDGTIDAEEGELTVILNPISETEMFNFGYKFVGYTLTVGTYAGTFTANTNTTFVIPTTGSNVQYLELNFVELEYRLIVSQYGGGYEGENVEFVKGGDTVNYSYIDVNNLTLEFSKPTGYYVINAYFVSNAENEYVYAKEENSVVSSIYSYTFTLSEWEDIVTQYGVEQEGEQEGESYIKVDMRVVYQIYTFEVQVSYSLTNAKNNSYDLLVPYPSINLTYVLDGMSENAEFTRTDNVLTFTGVPYGASVSLNVVGNIPQGFSAITAWTTSLDKKPEYPYSSSTYQLTFPSITRNEAFKYKLDYLSYEIQLIYENRGTPNILVNNTLASTVTLYDNLKIQTNANKASGFKFSNLYYYKQQFAPYTYDEITWNEKALNLYIYSQETYIKNESYEYNPNLYYYSLEDVRVDKNESTVFEDTFFDVANYKIESGKIFFYLDYDYIQVSIVNENGLYSGSATLNRGDISILPKDFTTYTIATYSNGVETVLEEGDTVDYLDTVIIKVKFNKVQINNEVFDLKRGLDLMLVNFLTYDAYSFDQLNDEEFSYMITLNMSNLIVNIPDSYVLNINYYYSVKQFDVTITTNINSASFYYSTYGRKFNLQANGIDGGFGGTIQVTGGQDKSLTYSFQFLGTVKYNFSFTDSNYSNYFKIIGIKLYNENGNELDDFANYGVYPQYDGNNLLERVDTRYVENVTIKLIVQPIIIYNGAQVVDGNYIFTSMFLCNNNGVGSSQCLTIGSTQAHQIQTSELILSCLQDESGNYKVRYIDENSIIVNPTNVGRYELQYIFNSTGEYEWLQEIDLNYKVYLDITPRDVYLTYTLTNTFEKTYDKNSNFDTSKILQYLVITDNAGININYSNQYNFVLSPDLAGTITYTYDGQEVETYRANEDVFYNVTLNNIAFVSSPFTNNFKLNNSTLILKNIIKINRKAIDIVGVSVYDKVFDGNTGISIKEDANITMRGIVLDDDVNLILDNISVSFENAEIGYNKNIIVATEDSLIGDDASNYKLNPITNVKASIYPYKLSANVEGFGEITIINERALTDKSKVSLIPIGASLNINTFGNDSQEYLKIYNNIANYLTNGKVFEIGLEISFVQNGVELKVPNDLFIIVPKIDRFTSIVYLTGAYSGELTYEENQNYLIIDLSQFEAEVNTLILTKQRILLKLWQIIVIVIVAVILIIAIVIIVLVVRKKRYERYSVNDKI